ncbi:hypothetical protein [Methylobacterium brachiatum]|jgi:hypothetical protein|uniref:Uncharacterized protein n=1 Tax=Methylobacterium brachiatum TaxID=269660 RepID=A0ABV1RAQ7_9HYPH|nr:hypothetical protein [Methylobacterium brachiatum]MDH2308772.1 hypothetical protein [Methylobacterium brachiatum]CAA2156599.1 hypothetical protein MBRA_02044 [Methylobacterium brachiatum]SFI42429.1 hypothetical protein SAMN02799642_01816 [Methylobacterium brachiatum]
MKSSDDCDQGARSADVALEVLARAYHALAVVYELSSPGAYLALHGQMMPYLLDSFRDAQAPQADDPQIAELFSAALERVRCALDDVRCDVSAVRMRDGERDH